MPEVNLIFELVSPATVGKVWIDHIGEVEYNVPIRIDPFQQEGYRLKTGKTIEEVFGGRDGFRVHLEAEDELLEYPDIDASDVVGPEIIDADVAWPMDEGNGSDG